MFAFTKRNNNGMIDAVYCGRFSFVTGLNREDADAAVENLISDDLESDQLRIDVAEEFIHRNQFLRSPTGLAINGFRWFTRLIWCVARNKNFVINYYKIRSIYYLHAYEKFEREAKLFLDHGSSNQYFNSKLDIEILKEWVSSKTGFAGFSLFLLFPFFMLMGWMTTRHFTLVTQQLEENGDTWEMKEKNHSTGGYVNRIGSIKEKTLLHNLLSKLKIEKWFPNSAENDWQWMICKFYAEKAVWLSIRIRLIILTQES